LASSPLASSRSSCAVRSASGWTMRYLTGGMLPVRIDCPEYSARSYGRSHSEKLMMLRAPSTSASTNHDTGARFAYHGHCVWLLWQLKHARTASSRVRAELHCGSWIVTGFEWVRPQGT